MPIRKGIRINKYLAICGLGSRRKCEKLIQNGKIKINDRVAVLSDIVEKNDKVFIENKLLKPEEKVYYIFYKPPFVLSTLYDPRGRKTIKDYITHINKRVFPVGRLDFESEGLILLTNDGNLAHRILHPKYQVEKEYIVQTDRPLTRKEEKEFQKGVKLEEGITSTCRLSRQGNYYRIVLKQGWYRQIRRMFNKFNVNVTFLKRIKIANLSIGNLKKGEVRQLNTKEIKDLRRSVF